MAKLCWRPGNWLLAVHRLFTLRPRLSLHRPPADAATGWSVWWLWFEVAHVRPLPRETFTCQGCGDGPWDIAWDPHEQPVLGRIGGRFCPNCSGAD